MLFPERMHLDAAHGAAEERKRTVSEYGERVPEASNNVLRQKLLRMAGYAGQRVKAVHLFWS